jgi:hypothetical protein
MFDVDFSVMVEQDSFLALDRFGATGVLMRC